MRSPTLPSFPRGFCSRRSNGPGYRWRDFVLPAVKLELTASKTEKKRYEP